MYTNPTSIAGYIIVSAWVLVTGLLIQSNLGSETSATTVQTVITVLFVWSVAILVVGPLAAWVFSGRQTIDGTPVVMNCNLLDLVGFVGLTFWPCVFLAPVPKPSGDRVKSSPRNMESSAHLHGDFVVEMSSADGGAASKTMLWCDAVTLCHERVHLAQQAECGLLPFYVFYVGEFLLGCVLRTAGYLLPGKKAASNGPREDSGGVVCENFLDCVQAAYHAISFEGEAYGHEDALLTKTGRLRRDALAVNKRFLEDRQRFNFLRFSHAF
jgi:hypothetical protein